MAEPPLCERGESGFDSHLSTHDPLMKFGQTWRLANPLFTGSNPVRISMKIQKVNIKLSKKAKKVLEKDRSEAKTWEEWKEYNKKHPDPWWEVNLIWPLERFWEKIKDIPREIKWFWQRGKRGYADSDLWSLDFYLESWLPEALNQLAKETIGSPGEPMTFKEWQRILRKMAKGFKMVRDAENDFNWKNTKAKIKRNKKAYEQEQESLKLMT